MDYKILTSGEFYDKYSDKLTPGLFKFITAAYRQSDNTIAIFPSENNVDCYFQLPTYKTTTVPFKRRYIYKLNKETISKCNFLILEDGRYKIPVTELELFADPYDESLSVNFIEVEKKIEQEVADLNKEPEETDLERVARELEEAINRATELTNKLNELSDKGDSVFDKLKKMVYGRSKN